MELFKKDSNVKFKHGVAYLHKYADFPFFFEKNGEFWIVMDIRIRNAIIKLTNYLDKENIKYYFLSPGLDWSYFIKKVTDFTKEEQAIILYQYFFVLSNDAFFKDIHKIGYINALTNFVMKYKCIEVFKKEFDKIKNSKNYFINIHNRRGGLIQLEHKEQRAFFDSLYRMVAISCFGI